VSRKNVALGVYVGVAINAELVKDKYAFGVMSYMA
tara:strand:- start:568 stop:672 length:105 start_codon:yes stop_codon:yes gene_type:complete